MCPKVHIAELRTAPRCSHPDALSLAPAASLVPTGQVGEGRSGVWAAPFGHHPLLPLVLLLPPEGVEQAGARAWCSPSRGLCPVDPRPAEPCPLPAPDSPDETANGEKEEFWVTMKLPIKSPMQGEAVTVSLTLTAEILLGREVTGLC